MYAISNLFRKEFILKSDAATKEKVLSEIGDILFENGLVKESFRDAIIERETKYPTGIDLSPIADGLPSIALPHVDAKHCRDQAIIFVKLNQAISFNNMINPEEELAVRYLFVLVNNHKTKQTTVLADLMGFMTDEANVKKLDTFDSTEEIYKFLTSKKGSEGY